MKFLATLFLVIISIITHAQPSQNENFTWLLGDWHRTNNQAGKITTETWRLSEMEYRGLGVTVEGQDTVFFENMALINIENEMFLVVSTPEHEVAVHFKITAQSNESFTAENPDNDFPKKIIYKKTNQGLLATVSGGDKKIDFVFERVED